MDTMRGILLLVVTLIIIVSIYYIVKMVKGKRTPTQPSPSPSPSPSDQTDEISISDLTFERTLNPDKSNSKGGNIVGYIIEYDEGDGGIDYDELSRNVTFTLNWKNNIGFTDKVKGFKIEHYVSGDNEFDKFTKELNPEPANQSIDFKTKNAVNLNNFGENSVSIVSNGGYSVVGKNRFKIKVIMNDGTPKLLYNGLDDTNINETTHEIVISEQDLGATLTMTKPQTVTYTPVTRSFSTVYQIEKIKYWISNKNTNLNIDDEFIYLIPAFSGTTTTTGTTSSVKTGADTFFFQYEDGDYLLYNAKKDKWNKSVKRSDDKNIILNDSNTTGNDAYDNRMYVSFYNKSEDGNTMELRKVKMGYGYGEKMITSDKDGNLKFMSALDTDSVDETEFINSKWTFAETKPCSFVLPESDKNHVKAWFSSYRTEDERSKIEKRCEDKSDACTSTDKIFKESDFVFTETDCDSKCAGKTGLGLVACKLGCISDNTAKQAVVNMVKNDIINKQYKDACK